MISRRNFIRMISAIGLQSAYGFNVAPSANAEGHVTVKQKRILGSKTNRLEVSALGFGVMGMTYNRGPLKDRSQMIRLLHEAVDRGILLFDTAEVYGPHTNEILAGEALSQYKNISVTTKFGHKIVNGKYFYGQLDSSPAQIRKVCEESLKRLKRDRIDIFYQHRMDPSVPIEVVAETVGQLIKEGKVGGFGLCEVDAQTIRRAHQIQPLTAVQSEYHLMWDRPEKNIFPTLQELGIGFVPYSPLNRGFLTGAIGPDRRFDEKNDNRATLPRFTPKAIKENLKIVEALRTFGLNYEATPAQVALGCLLQKAPWIVPIPGTTDAAHFKENLAALELDIPTQEWAQLEKTVRTLPIMGDSYNAVQQKQVA